MTTTTTLDAADAIELAQLLEFLDDWLHDNTDVAASYQHFTDGHLTTDDLRNDLARFSFLLGGDSPHYLDG